VLEKVATDGCARGCCCCGGLPVGWHGVCIEILKWISRFGGLRGVNECQ
jgi:hypothetical protein